MSKQKKPWIYYGWFILGGAFLVTVVGYSMRYSFSIFYPEILNEFGWSRAETAAAFSINLLVYGMSSPVVGTMTDRFGPRRVLLFGVCVLAIGLLAMSQMNSIWLFYFLFGIVIAVGINSLGHAVHLTYLSNWFIKWRGLAFGVIIAGAGGGNAIVAFYQNLISGLGWRGAYTVLAAIAFVVVVPLAIFLIRRTPQELGLLPDSTAANLAKGGSGAATESRVDLFTVDKEWVATDWTLAKALRTYRLWFMFLHFLTFSMSYNLVMAHQPIHCQDIGFGAMFAAYIFGLTGVAQMVGNICGFMSDRIGREVTYTVGTFGSVLAIIALVLANTSQPWLLYLYVILWGIFLGTLGPTTFSSSADIFAGKHFGAINGFCLLGFGIGGAIGPWLGGYIFDVTNSYTIAFGIVIIVIMLSAVFLWLAAPRKVRLVAGKVPRAFTG